MSKVRVNRLRVEMTRAEALWTPEDVVLYYGDSYANKIVFALFNAGTAVSTVGYTASIQIRRPDNVIVYVEATNTAGELSCILPGSCYERSGILGMVLRLVDAEGTATAVSFYVYVRGSADGGATGVVESDVINLADLLNLKRQLEILRELGLRIIGFAQTPEELEGVPGQYGDARLVGDYAYYWTPQGWTRGPKLYAKDGRGIEKVERTLGTGLPESADVYTITYTDQTTWSYTVRNGNNGADGLDGQDGAAVTENTAFASLKTQDKKLVGGVNEIYDMLLGTADVLDMIMGGG